MKQYAILIQDPEGYSPDIATGIPLMVHTAIKVEDIKTYLDQAIADWRLIGDQGKIHSADFAPHYIDAFQAVRDSLLGETKP